MAYTWTYKRGKLDNDDAKFYERVNPGYKCTGETLEERYKADNELDEGATTYVVMKGKFTPFGMCRDCGNHYIIAHYTHYVRVDKDTLKREVDVEDY